MCGIGEASWRQPKSRVYRAVVLTTLLYDCEMWTTHQQHIKKTKPLSHNLSQEDSQHHMAKTYLRHWSLNSGFFCQHLHDLDAITTSLGQSCCPPPEETALRWTISVQALPRRPEKVLQRHTERLHEIFWYCPSLSGISGERQRQVAWSCQMWSENLWNQKKHSKWAA